MSFVSTDEVSHQAVQQRPERKQGRLLASKPHHSFRESVRGSHACDEDDKDGKMTQLSRSHSLPRWARLTNKTRAVISVDAALLHSYHDKDGNMTVDAALLAAGSAA